MRLARLIRFFRPQPSKIALSVEEVLGSSSAVNVVDQFNKLYYESGTAGNLQWRGIEILKNPCDLWMMLELISRVRPSVLIETGTHYGGSALYFAEMASLLGQPCSVITVDINPKLAYRPEDYGIVPVVGYSTDSACGWHGVVYPSR
jgi:cephalosporin hydroxylase